MTALTASSNPGIDKAKKGIRDRQRSPNDLEIQPLSEVVKFLSTSTTEDIQVGHERRHDPLCSG